MIGIWLAVAFGISLLTVCPMLYSACAHRRDLQGALQECRERVIRSNARAAELESELKKEVTRKCCAESSSEAFKCEVKRLVEQLEKLQKQHDALSEAKDYNASYVEARAREWHAELEAKETSIKSLEHRLSVAQKDREAFLSELTTAKSIIRNMWEPVKEIEAAISYMQETQEGSNA